MQKVWRGFIIRKNKNNLFKYREEKEKKRTQKSEKAYTTVQKFRSKFLSSKIHTRFPNEDEGYKNFCVAKIGATFRMSLTRRLFKFHRFSMYHIAVLEIQAAWKKYLAAHPKKSKEDVAAYKIQM